MSGNTAWVFNPRLETSHLNSLWDKGGSTISTPLCPQLDPAKCESHGPAFSLVPGWRRRALFLRFPLPLGAYRRLLFQLSEGAFHRFLRYLPSWMWGSQTLCVPQATVHTGQLGFSQTVKKYKIMISVNYGIERKLEPVNILLQYLFQLNITTLRTGFDSSICLT